MTPPAVIVHHNEIYVYKRIRAPYTPQPYRHWNDHTDLCVCSYIYTLLHLLQNGISYCPFGVFHKPYIVEITMTTRNVVYIAYMCFQL